MKIKIGRLIRLLSACLVGAGIFRYNNQIYNELDREKEKYRYYYNLMAQWKKDGDGKIEEYCKKSQIRTAAIYGMGVMGELLYEQLLNNNVKVLYAVDQNPTLKKAFRIISKTMINEQEMADVIIVSTCFYYEDIACELSGDDINIPIISLEELLR